MVKCLTILLLLREVYLSVTNQLKVPQNNTKNIEGIKAEVLGYTINTIVIEIKLSPAKQ
jgi:hypothetical protein